MKTCSFFNRCGGCKYDFAAADYQSKKAGELRGIDTTGDAVWIAPGARRRAEFCFAGTQFGFYATRSKDIVPITNCPNLVDAINAVLPQIACLPWTGSGACLVTSCDNGIDVCVTSDVPYFSPEFKSAAEKLPVLRVTWNGRPVMQRAVPRVSFDGVAVDYPAGAFLQPSIQGADSLRQMVVDAARGAKRVADLFCGLGNFTFALNADGFDIVGTGAKRDLFKNPLTLGMLQQYDCVVMDPPRAGADAQCKILAKSDVSRIIYVSCNPNTFRRDAQILMRGGYKMRTLIPVDQFAGSAHWEIFSVFEK
ncbi:MAG: hypothetical protein K2M34_04490 [Alphaproteobacteria bacterium]|nr:hypothetical protein [Alphaproteobacteria bacterium]